MTYFCIFGDMFGITKEYEVNTTPPPPPPPWGFFTNFWKDDLLYCAKTFSSCLLVPSGIFDVSNIRPRYLTLPWQRHNYKQVWPTIVILAFSLFLHFFETKSHIFCIPLASWLHFASMSVFCDLENGKIKKGGSNIRLKLRHVTWEEVKVIQFLHLNRNKTLGRGFTYPPLSG